MNDTLFITKHTKSFILNLDEFIINLPKKENYMKDKLLDTSLEILKDIYIANYRKKEKRKEIQIEILSLLHLLDFYIERLYNKKYISEKQCLKKCHELSIISKMVYKWTYESRYQNS